MPPARRRGIAPDQLPRYTDAQLRTFTEADLSRISQAFLSPTRQAQARTELLRRKGSLAIDAPRASSTAAGRSSGG